MTRRSEDRVHLCTSCHWEKVPYKRWQLGFYTCLPCGEEQAKAVKHCIVPMPKSNYIVVTDHSLLIGLNNSHKGGVK